MEKMKIAILEDEFIVVKDLKARLIEMNYDVVAIFADGESLIDYLGKNFVDLLLVDIHLEGKLNGIETVHAIKSLTSAPVIFVTAQADRATFSEAKEVKPSAYLVKPYNDFELQTTIELALENHFEKGGDDTEYIVNEQIFVRGKNRFERVNLCDILYMEAAGNYTSIITANNKYVLTAKLGYLENQLKEVYLFRCHRSYMVNLKEVDSFDNLNVFIGEYQIPISKRSKKGFLERLRIV